MNLYGLIRAFWFASGDEIDKPPHLQAHDDMARKLDALLTSKFKEPLQQFDDGLISSVELLDKLYYEAHRDLRPEEVADL